MPNNTTYFISDEVFRIRSLHERVLSEWYDYFSTFQIINNYSISLYRQYAIGYPPAAIELQNWHPECIGQTKDVVFGLGLSQDDIQLAMARMFGYTDWEQVIERDSLIDRGFEMAVDLMLSGDIVQLEMRLLQAPQLVNANSPFGHQAGLIHYIAANGVETHRQITPYNAPEILQLLLDMGADHMQDIGRTFEC